MHRSSGHGDNKGALRGGRVGRQLRRWLSVLLLVALVVSVMPVSMALAESGGGGAATGTDLAPADDGGEAPSGGICTAKDYCTDPLCDCASGGECTCADDCPCKTLEQRPCVTPEACADTGCQCKHPSDATQHAPDKCVCDDDCMCRMPAFSLQVDTRIDAKNAVELDTGKLAKLSVTYNINSSEVLFSNIRIKTYIAAPLEPVDVLIQGTTKLEGVYPPGHEKNPDSTTHTLVVASCNAKNSAAGTYSFDVRFPAGVTQTGIVCDAYSYIEADLTMEGEVYHAREVHNIKSDAHYLAEATSKAESAWQLTLSNVDLDYKDPADGDDIFRVKVELGRQPNNTDEGVYYLLDDAALSISFFDNVADLSGADLGILRVTTTDGTVVPPAKWSLSGNRLSISAGDIGMTPGFSGSPATSPATSAAFYVVYTVSRSFLTQIGREDVPGFYIYDAENSAQLDYQFVDGVARQATDTTTFEELTYTPGKGGTGSMGKYAEPFVEGSTFFKDAADPNHTPIVFDVRYHNNSNSPVTDLVITDPRPQAVGTGGSDISGSVPEKSVFYTKVKVESWNAETYADAGFACNLHIYENGAQAAVLPVAKGDEITLADHVTDVKDIDKLELRTDGELRHGFSLRLLFTVSGDAALADDAQEANRNLIYYVRNQARFEATSTKEGAKVLSGVSHNRYVHVYPFAGGAKHLPVWRLNGTASNNTAASFTDSVTVSHQKPFYLRLTVTPKAVDRELDFLYSPVFFVELPPEVNYANEVTYSGAAGDIGLDAEVINNPLGAGKLLRVQAPGKTLLEPLAGGGSLTVKCLLDDETPYGVAFSSRVFFGTTDDQVPLDDTDSGIQAASITLTAGEQAALFGQGQAAAPLLLVDAISIQVNGSGLLEGALWVQTELDRDAGAPEADWAWHRHPTIADTLHGGLLNYRFQVNNDGHYPAGEMVLYCVFSSVDDKYLVNNSSRNSRWEPYLTGPVVLPAELAAATVYYSDYATHSVSTSGVYTGADDWTTTPYSYPAVKAVKIVMASNYTLKPNKSLTITVPMYAPVDYNCVGDPGDKKDLAICSLATQFKFDTDASNPSFTQALEPLKVAVNLVPNERGEISGVIWSDQVKNGLKGLEDPDPDKREYPLEGVTVELYDNSGNFLQDRVTDKQGEYKFTYLDNGNYMLRALLPSGYGASEAGADNDFTVAGSGYVELAGAINIFRGGTEAQRKITDVDGGLYAKPGTISGTVWRDLNGDGVRDNNTDGGFRDDAAMPGVEVELYRIYSGGEAKVARSATTGAGGEYAFDQLPPGRYYVVVKRPTVVANYSFPKRATAQASTLVTTIDTVSAGAAGYSHGAAAAVEDTFTVMGQTPDIWLRPGATQAGVDCGLTPKAGSIAGRLWHDLNGSGAEDTGEGGLAGLSVSLTQTSGYGMGTPIADAVTTEGGAFVFENLLPGEYTLAYDGTADDYYVSVYGGAGVAEAARAHDAEYAAIEVDPADTLAHTGKDLGLVKKFTLAGRLFNDKNANGAYDAGGGTPDVNTAGGTVTVYRYPSAGRQGTPEQVAVLSTSEPDGYTTGQLWPGHYAVVFSGLPSPLDDYLTTTSHDWFSRVGLSWTLDNIPSGCKKLGALPLNQVSLGRTRPRTLAGTVWLDKDGSAAWETGEAYLARRLTLAAGSGTSLPEGYTGSPTTSLLADGTYSFAGLYPGTYTVTVDRADGSDPAYLVTNASSALTAAGVYTITIPVVDSGDDDAHSHYDIGLAKPVTLSGSVWRDGDLDTSNYTSNGTYSTADADEPLALAGVAAAYRKVGGAYQATAVKTVGTSASGAYTLDGLLPGTYKIVLSPGTDYYFTGPAKTHSNGDFAPDEAGGKAAWEEIETLSDERFGGYDLSLGEYSVISGTLWHDVDGNGAMDTTEAVMSPDEVVVLTRTAPGSSAVLKTENSASGLYSYKVKPGEYTVQVGRNNRRLTNPATDTQAGFVGAGDSTATPTWPVVNQSTEKVEMSGKNFLFSIQGVISGSVWVDANASGAKDSGEANKTGVRVTLACESADIQDWWATYDATPKTQDASSGGYSYTHLWPGSYTVTLSGVSAADIEGYLRTNASGSTSVTQVGANQWQWRVVLGSSLTSQADFGMVKPSTLKGDFFRDQNGDKAKGASPAEPSIGKATLARAGVTGNMLPYSDEVTLQAGGSGFAFTGLLPGSYTLTLSGVEANWPRTCFTSGALTLETGTGSGAMAAVTDNERSYTLTIADDDGTGVVLANAVAGYCAPGAITGTVYHDGNRNDAYEPSSPESETPLSGVTAVIKKYDGAAYQGSFAPAPVTVSADGEFSFSGLLPGKYEVTFTGLPTGWLLTTPDKTLAPAGGPSATFAKTTARWLVEMSADGQAAVLDTGLVQPGSASGKVWKDEDASGANNSEPDYAGLTVTLYKNYGTSGAETVDTDTTAADGSYSFTGLMPGTYTVVLTPPAGTWYVTNTGPNTYTNPWLIHITVPENGSTTGHNFGLVQPVTLGGRVWQDKGASGANGNYEPGTDTPLASQSLTITGTGGAALGYSGTATTDSNGLYSVGDLLPGTYTVALAGNADLILVNNDLSLGSGANTATLAPATRTWTVNITGGNQREDCHYALADRAVLHVRVWEDMNADGTRNNSTDLPVEGITIELFEHDGSGYNTPITGSFATGEDGLYTHNLLTTGKIRVVITLPAADGTYPDWFVTSPGGEALSIDIDVTALSTTHYADFGISRYVNLAGFVWLDPEADGAYGSADSPLAGHDVKALRGGVLAATLTTGPDGKYASTSADKLKPGSYTVEITEKAGHAASYTAENFDRPTRVWTLPQPLLSGGAAEGLDCAFAALQPVSGRLWADVRATGSLVPGDGDHGINGAAITLARLPETTGKGPGALTVDVATDPDGYFTATDVLPGTYVVQLGDLENLSLGSYTPGAGKTITPVYTGCVNFCTDCPHGESAFDLRTGQWLLSVADTELRNVNSGVHAGSEISGVLLRSGSNKPIAGQEVALYKLGENGEYELWTSTVTGEDGSYLFGGLLPGSYEVRVAIPSGTSISPGSDGTQSGSYVVINSLSIEDMGVVIESTVLVRTKGSGRDKNGGAPGGDANAEAEALAALLSPQTGDTQSLAGAALLGVLSLGMLGTGVALRRGSRRRRKNAETES